MTIPCASALAAVSIVQGIVGGVSTSPAEGVPTVFSGARICFDLNGNGICDPGEPSTTSSPTGHFKLAYTTSAPLVAEIGTSFAFRAHVAQVRAATRNPLLPATVNLTPLSTEIARSIESRGLAAPAAVAELARRIGVAHAANVLLAPTEVTDAGDRAAILRESVLAQRQFGASATR